MNGSITPIIALAFTVLVLVCVFVFVSVIIWAETRRKERESLYRSELLKKLAETPGPGADAVLTSLRDDELRKHARRREYITLAGVLCLALGLAVLIGHFMTPDTRNDGVWALCFIPMLLGFALIGHARFIMARSRPAS
jgi:hypothetical protein